MKRVFVLLLLLFAGGGVVWGGTNETRTTDVSFTARVDGAEQRYVLMLPAGFHQDEPHDLLIALHGHGSDRWQFIRDTRDECRAARYVAATHTNDLPHAGLPRKNFLDGPAGRSRSRPNHR
ncbi:MAG: hypothetical protein V9H26_15175 [Verrucomicrobiota bacterium]